MTDCKEAKATQLGPLDEEELIPGGTRYFIKGFGSRPAFGLRNIAGGLGRGSVALVLQLFFLTLFAMILVVVLVKVSKVPNYQEQKQVKQKINKEMSQLKIGIGRLCRPCSWDWTFFQSNCYFFSDSRLNWSDSVAACQEMRAQLVVIKSPEEQNFLQLNSKNRGPTWMGLSDLKKEGIWHWLDGSHLWFRFTKYWLPGEPNNDGKEDCAEFRGNGWNDGKCERQKFWICKRPAASCSDM
ncbi:CD209 antigen-like protein C [Octodon degus]|uniref:CD209 antigen-like protein C n=1 Tax=Octodon degus TaxID=10160 RepID=A0A6P3FE76_OCTDE|nr:CD209 antigen-like protein C [Octodon degus]